MAKNKIKYFDHQNLGDSVPFLSLDKKPIEDGDQEKSSLISMIFDFDPVTGLPSDDVGMYLNKNVAPEVLAFIRDNLMQDMSSFAAPGVPAGVDDDVILSLSRDANESRDSYIQRVREFMNGEKSIIEQARKSV